MESYLTVVASLPTPGTGSSPKTSILPITNAIRSLKEAFQHPAQCSFYHSVTLQTKLSVAPLAPALEACRSWMPTEEKRKGGRKEKPRRAWHFLRESQLSLTHEDQKAGSSKKRKQCHCRAITGGRGPSNCPLWGHL